MAEYKSWDITPTPRFPLVQEPSSSIEVVATAARNENLVAIRYRAKDGVETERIIEPYEIKEGKLFGYDIDKNGIRAFLIPNLLGAVAIDRKFEPRFPILIQSPYYTDIDG